MKLILIFMTLVLTACGSSGSGPSTAPGLPVDTLPVPTPSPTPSQSPAPVPIASPTPVPQYTTANYPLAGKTLSNPGMYSLVLNQDGSYMFSDTSHIQYGNWMPDSNPNDVVLGNNTESWPVTLTPSGAYVCLPANGPQTCQDTGFAGAVTLDFIGNSSNTLVINQ